MKRLLLLYDGASETVALTIDLKATSAPSPLRLHAVVALATGEKRRALPTIHGRAVLLSQHENITETTVNQEPVR